MRVVRRLDGETFGNERQLRTGSYEKSPGGGPRLFGLLRFAEIKIMPAALSGLFTDSAADV